MLSLDIQRYTMLFFLQHTTHLPPKGRLFASSSEDQLSELAAAIDCCCWLFPPPTCEVSSVSASTLESPVVVWNNRKYIFES